VEAVPLERRIGVRQNLRFFSQGSSRTLSANWRRLDDRIEGVTDEVEQLAHGSESCRYLMTVPGIGPLIASAMVAAIANGVAFAKGRDFAARLGLVPKQMSTGDRTILGRVSKRGNR
jgi:transposase